jgi:ParB-like chromosome segregation protein Spo0J
MTTTDNIYDIKINEEYAKLAPDLSELEFKSLKESIKINGLHYAIAVNKDNVLLDGHHRYKACQELGIEPRIEVKDFANPLDEKLFVIEMATHRRHLNDFQKAELGVKRESLLKEIAKQNSLANLKKGDSLPTSSNEPLGAVAVNVAKSVNLSPATYKRAKYIIENGSEQQKQKLREGKARIHTEYKFATHVQKRSEMIAEAKSSKVLDEFFKDNPDQNQIKLLLGDLREEAKQIPDNSVDLIFTDPPYETADLPLYAELAKLALRVLKPGGSLVTYAGHYALPQVFDYLEEQVEHSNLKYIHQIIVQHSGQREILFAYNIGVKYKPLLWFVKGVNSPYGTGSTSYLEDVILSEPVGKEFHKWQQSAVEAEYMISHLTVENQVVLDPFLGGATTAIAALKLNRKFIGIEIEEDYYNIAKSRIAEFLSSSKNKK